MKVLLDQGTPAPLRHALSDHNVSTAYEMGWSELDNGALLREAETYFEILITTDRNLRYQQNLDRRNLAILILPTRNWPKLRARLAEIVGAVNVLHRGEVVELELE
jgi:hypothetical protein